MDLVPMILMIILFAFLISTIDDCVKDYVGGSVWTWWSCLKAGAAVTGLVALMPAIPFLYSLAQVAVIVMAVLLFPTWFYFGYRYSMVDIRFGKFLTNLTSFVISIFIKVIPVLNLLPFPTIALTVWRHVQYSRKEDREKAKDTAPVSPQGVEVYAAA